ISLQLIEEGDSAVSLMPSFMAYGSYGDRNQIGGNEPLIFKVKILDIKKREK
ncbi:MAG: FKBP-type peptidylprolyl isomerase, partial [Flavobacteriia bacterium]|nr:FKBP-type peptidylprolyl isomerase [Flavobacteriia bacterium]